MARTTVGFTHEEIVRGRNKADLLEYGDFIAGTIEIDFESPYWIEVHGELSTQPRHLDEPVDLDVTLEIYLDWGGQEPPSPEELAEWSAADIFNSAWDGWHTFDIPAEWKYSIYGRN